MINPLAVVQTSEIGEDVQISEFVVIRPNVIIGSRVIIHPHVVIEEYVTIGDDTEIFPGTYIGKAPKAPTGVLSRTLGFQRHTEIGARVYWAKCDDLLRHVDW